MKRQRFRIITILADIAILTLSFLVMVWIKPASLRTYLPSHSIFFGGLAIVWIIISLINGKMHRGKIINYSTLFSRVLISNLIAISITALIMYVLRDEFYSRLIVLGTTVLATFFELFFGSIYIAYKKAYLQDMENNENWENFKKTSEYELVEELNGNGNGNGHHEKISGKVNPGIARAIILEGGKEMAEAIIKMTGPELTDRTAVLSTTNTFNILSLPEKKYSYIINLHKLNDIRKTDDFIDAVNKKLDAGGYFFCCVETKDQRKERLLKKYPPVLNYILYTFDFILKRIFPKLKLTRGLYNFLTRGENTVFSRAEALGRISRGGFKIMQESFIGNKLCIEAKKWGEPFPCNSNISSTLIALPRIGKNGRILKVYKLRTMHPYSEYIQSYIYKVHDLQNGGKFKNDFRITSWGSFARKVWLDELPMVINLLRGDMKLVGVRPLSKQYFELYRKDVQSRRIQYKPGLIPPFYADMPADLDEIQASELKYLESFDRSPLITDLQYLRKSVWNIMFKKARSN
jgi:lipopolysaccharide/colanic/teichoic acid biosynthesis glycosyltransferase